VKGKFCDLVHEKLTIKRVEECKRRLGTSIVENDISASEKAVYLDDSIYVLILMFK